MPRRRHHQRGVEPTGRQIEVNLVLILIRHHVHARRRPMGFGVNLLNRSLQHAHVFARQRFGVRQQAAAGLGDQAVRHLIDGVGEGDRLTPLFGHVHRRVDGVELARLQRRDQAVERGFHPAALQLRGGAHRVAQFDVEPFQFAAGGFGFERRIQRFQAEAQAVFRRQRSAGGQQASGGEQRFQCFHRQCPFPMVGQKITPGSGGARLPAGSRYLWKNSAG
ncbi:Uncharacterised protein [Serratia marcescens]|nr:Uncharacterised protein [Serratia marcescens]CVB32120.1 Uncharacterised protein [Serratia marcescens]